SATPVLLCRASRTSIDGLSPLRSTVSRMSFHLRSLSARRYRVEGALPSVHAPEFAKRLLDRRFQALTANEEKTHGWVTVDNCLDSAFTAEAVAKGPCAAFALRTDRRRVNGRVLRAMVDLELRGRA